MTKQELVSEVASRAGMKKSDVVKIIDSLVEVLRTQLAEGKKVRINGLGIFNVVKRNKKTVRNPQTGKKMTVPEKNVVKFKAAKVLNEAIN